MGMDVRQTQLRHPPKVSTSVSSRREPPKLPNLEKTYDPKKSSIVTASVPLGEVAEEPKAEPKGSPAGSPSVREKILEAARKAARKAKKKVKKKKKAEASDTALEGDEDEEVPTGFCSPGF